MPKLKHRSLILIAGGVWLAVGVFLLILGLRLIIHEIKYPLLAEIGNRFSLIAACSKLTHGNRQNAVVAILTGALIIGHLKGRFVLSKSVLRQIQRIRSLPNPSSLRYLYSKGYYFLIGSMILLGIGMRFLPITPGTRGAVDVAIGSALINGALLYFRSLAAYALNANKKQG